MCHESHGAHHKSYRSHKGSHKGSHQDVQGIPQRIDKGLETIHGNLESSHNFNIISELNVISAIQWKSKIVLASTGCRAATTTTTAQDDDGVVVRWDAAAILAAEQALEFWAHRAEYHGDDRRRDCRGGRDGWDRRRGRRREPKRRQIFVDNRGRSSAPRQPCVQRRLGVGTAIDAPPPQM